MPTQRYVPDGEIEHHVRRWLVMSILTGRYSVSAETTIDYEIRQIQRRSHLAPGPSPLRELTLTG